MENRIEIGSLKIDKDLYALVQDEIAPIGVNLAVSNYDRCGFLTAPFCPNTSNNAKDENSSVRPRAIHAPLFF